MTSAHFAASAVVITSRPLFRARFARDLLPAGKPTANLNAGVLQVERVRMALRAVADDGHLLCLDQ